MGLIILVVTGYLAIAYGVAGASLAYWQRKYHSARPGEWYRQDIAFSWFVSLLPGFCLVIPFLTNFFQYGWMSPIGRGPGSNAK